ncbi:tRNA pseudouridine(38-40) synthase TruA [Demequina sp. SYSU T00068]|uniref:tRNA pseudouridine(38-40) synthase TruA n=1 Tax=Demequina lignilytica TaxID=3051663 RepID=UPI00261A1A02|nr:tRNA pseudouridine(38-40) synthase TruA [Demequina sp. SYSU T00068]MDN4490040.1 tRNA pseudouridine(38-40) synthase TruA [Demequina sp. SYSU T00068]
MLPETVRARLDLSYDGTDFSGWATQPGLRTVQGVLEDALARVVRQEAHPRVTVAGRTDAGVHARGQVAHVDIDAGAWARMPGRAERTPAEGLLTRLNGVLPDDAVVRSVAVASAGFDARFSATERRYAYRVTDAVPDVLLRRHVLAVGRPLDVDALNAASSILRGLRDFAPFCKAREGATTIRELKELSWVRETDGPDTGLVVATVRADAFCHSMVRSLVGALLAVGEGRRDLDWFAAIASGSERSQAVAVAPPHGLTLEEVGYPEDAELAARAEATRGRRTLP